MDETKSRDSEKQGTLKRKAEGSRLLEPAGACWNVDQARRGAETRKLYYCTTKSIFYISLQLT